MASSTTIYNIVITGNTGQKIKLEHLAIAWQNYGVHLNEKKFPNLVLALSKPKCTVLIFRSGKVVVQGSQFTSAGQYVFRRVCEMLREVGYVHARALSMRVQNVVGNSTCGHQVDLDALAAYLGEYCVYEPELFPGARVRRIPQLEGVTVLVFLTGSLLLTGGKSPAQVRRVARVFKVIASRFRLAPGGGGGERAHEAPVRRRARRQKRQRSLAISRENDTEKAKRLFEKSKSHSALVKSVFE